MTASSPTAKPTHWDPRTDRKAYIVWLGVVVAAIVAGFGVDFARYMGERPAPPLILHLHAAVYVAWLCLVAAQILLVERGDIRLHRRLGWATAVVALVMVPLGLTAAMVDEVRTLGHGGEPQFLALEFEEMIGFSVFTVAGLLLRRDPAAHKRLMILSAVAISDAGFARAWITVVKVTLPGPIGWWWQYFWGIALILVAMAGWDLWRRGRIHPTVIAGAALLLGGQAVVTALYYSPGWKALMTHLIVAWGYAG